jgi:hypothetical protein
MAPKCVPTEYPQDMESKAANAGSDESKEALQKPSADGAGSAQELKRLQSLLEESQILRDEQAEELVMVKLECEETRAALDSITTEKTQVCLPCKLQGVLILAHESSA